MKNKFKPLAQLNHEVSLYLIKRFGLEDTARFLRQFITGMGNYTEERKVMFKDYSWDDYNKDLEELRASQKK